MLTEGSEEQAFVERQKAKSVDFKDRRFELFPKNPDMFPKGTMLEVKYV